MGCALKEVENATNTVVKKGYSPFISNETGTWFVYNDELNKFIDTEIPARGPEGPGITSVYINENGELIAVFKD